MHGFSTAGEIGAPNPHIVEGLTVYMVVFTPGSYHRALCNFPSDRSTGTRTSTMLDG